MEFRPHAVNVELAKRMGVDLEDRSLRLVAGVWASIIMTALADLGRCRTRVARVGIDDAVDRIEATFARVQPPHRRRRRAGLNPCRTPRGRDCHNGTTF